MGWEFQPAEPNPDGRTSMSAKRVVNLQVRTGNTYKVVSTTNTIEPEPGDILNKKQVDDLIVQCSWVNSDLTVNVKA